MINRNGLKNGYNRQQVPGIPGTPDILCHCNNKVYDTLIKVRHLRK